MGIAICINLAFFGYAFTLSPPCYSKSPTSKIIEHSRTHSSILFTKSKDVTDNSPDTKPSNGKRKYTEARRPSVESGLRYRSDDWIGNFLSIPNSYVLLRIRFHLLSNTIITAIVVLLNVFGIKARIPLVGHSLLGAFLGLLLVFRTNSAYARFWEGRAVWTKTLSICRSMAFSIVNYMNDHSPKSAGRLMELLYNFPDALAHSCLPSGSSTVSEGVQKLLKEEDLNSGVAPAIVMMQYMHKNIHDASLESTSYQSNYVEAMHLVEISHLIGSLGDSVANADKILRTPIPLSYSRHTSRFLTIWSGTLPFALVRELGVVTLPVMAICCWCLFGIEEIGHLIEQPFVGDKTAGEEINVSNNSILAIFPLVKRSSRTKPYDIGIPVKNLARNIKEEIKGLAAFGGMVC